MAAAAVPWTAASRPRQDAVLGGHQHLGQPAPGLVQPEVGGLDQAAAQDHHVGVEDGHEVGHADRGPPGEIGP